MSVSVLVVEDDLRLQGAIRDVLKELGVRVYLASTGAEATAAFTREQPDVVLLDVGLPDANGLDLLPRLKAESPDVVVVMITASAEIETAVVAMRRGAHDFVTKPFQLDRFRTSVKQAAEKVVMQRRIHRLVQDRVRDQPFIGRSRLVVDLLRKVDRIAAAGGATVLIRGETGTGKELIAKRIHMEGPRASAPFFGESCANLQENLLESNLFGHAKGAFTGAERDTSGLMELAADGTLFLDEIGEMPPVLQSKMLRVLEERVFHRVGDHRPLRLDAQILTATNRDLSAMVRDGTFREELYFRLDVVPLRIPPLREREEDVPLLLHHFLDRFNAELGREIQGFETDAMDALCRYSWPGNVRELRNMLERIVILWEGGAKIGRAQLPTAVVGAAPALEKPMDLAGRAEGATPAAGPRLAPLEVVVAEHLLEVYRHTGQNKAETARILGITRQTVQKKLERLEQLGLLEATETASS